MAASDPLKQIRGGAPSGAAPSRVGAQGSVGAGVSDPLAARARELHLLALDADALAARQREERDRIIMSLRAQDPKRWSYTALAEALGCSRELIALVVRRSRETANPPTSRGARSR